MHWTNLICLMICSNMIVLLIDKGLGLAIDNDLCYSQAPIIRLLIPS